MARYWYAKSYVAGVAYELREQYRAYGLLSFLPHRHIPHPSFPLRCKRCGAHRPITTIKKGQNQWPI